MKPFKYRRNAHKFIKRSPAKKSFHAFETEIAEDIKTSSLILFLLRNENRLQGSGADSSLEFNPIE